MTKCAICDHKPAVKSGYCQTCGDKIRKDSRPRNRFELFVTYREMVIGLEKRDDDKYHPVALKRNPANLPKTKTLNLNNYLTGYSREQIKKLKAAVLSSCAAQ